MLKTREGLGHFCV